MKRTIKEVLNLIDEKIKNAEIDLEKAYITDKVFPCPEKISTIQGEISAYTDCKILIETSHILEDHNDKTDK
jgi:hypothetical protein